MSAGDALQVVLLVLLLVFWVVVVVDLLTGFLDRWWK